MKIVKHGTRAASSKCGAADVLEDLGLPMDLKPEAVGEIGDEVGITFAFARTFHPAMRFRRPDSRRARHPVRVQLPGRR